MSKLSRRERVLIHMLAILTLVSVALMLFIIPSIRSWNAARDQLKTELYPQRDALEAIIARRDAVRQAREDAQARYDDAMIDMPPRMENEEIDRLVTNLCTAHALNVDGLVFAEQPSPQGLSSIRCVKATATVRGSLSSVPALMDAITGSLSLMVENYTQSANADNPLITINFLVYMLSD